MKWSFAVPRRYRATARWRLTLVFTALLAVVTVLVAAIVYTAMRYLPNYALSSPVAITAVPQSDAGADRRPPAIGQPHSFTVRTESDIFRALLLILVVVIVIAVVFGAVVSYWIAGRTLRPLRRINEAARIAATGSFAHRLRLAGPLDEITELGRTFDTMLDQLQQSFATHKNFAANASHELQTPLSTTKVILAVALKHPSQADWPAIARQLCAANERSIAIVDSLLDLTNIDHQVVASEATDLALLVAQSLAEAEHVIQGRRLTVRYTSTRTLVDGDPRLLRQLTTNLLGNAIRHNIDGGDVAIQVGGSENGPTLRMSNTGTVIPDAMVQRLVEPFVQFEPITSHREGHGLGLALCLTIVRAHRGTLALTAGETGGLTAEVYLPRAAKDCYSGSSGPRL